METKFCKHCQCEHPFTKGFWYFSKGKAVVCIIKSKSAWLSDKDKLDPTSERFDIDKLASKRESCRKWRNSNKEAANKATTDHYYANQEKMIQRARDERAKDGAKEARAEYRQANKDKHSRYKKEYAKKNQERIRERKKAKRNADPNTKLRLNLRRRINTAIKRSQRAGSAVRDLGCTIPELKQYLESKFQEGMTWGNWSYRGWHIDHIIPLASFDLSDRDQLLKACHYTNLQPLWAKDNLCKGSKVATSGDSMVK